MKFGRLHLPVSPTCNIKCKFCKRDYNNNDEDRPGVGCAGRGIITAVQLFKQQNIFEELGLDYVIYDVLAGVIGNSINTDYEKEIIDDFVKKTNTEVIEYVPRSVTVTQSKLRGKATIEAAPNSEQADIYRRLANKIANHTESKTPSPLGVEELRNWASSWGDQLLKIENERNAVNR